MTVHITGSGIEVGQALREWAERRVGLALGRFGGCVRRVTVRFSFGPGPAAARCQVAVSLRASGQVVAERAGPSVHAALEEAAEAAGRGLWRRLETERILGTRIAD